MGRKPIIEENQLSRVAVCLKFDVNSDFYNELVVPLRRTRDLSTFIVKLLKTYYDESSVTEVVDEAMGESSPFASIRESLERIAEMNITNQMAINSVKNTLEAGKSVLDEVQQNFSAMPQEEVDNTDIVEGFENVVGFEVDPSIEPLVLQRKPITKLIGSITPKQEQQEEVVEIAPEIVEAEVKGEQTQSIEQRVMLIEKKLESVDTMNSKLDKLLATLTSGATVVNDTPNVEIIDTPVENPVESVESEIVVEATSNEIVEDVEVIATVKDSPIDDEEELDLDADIDEDALFEQAMAMSQANVAAMQENEVAEEEAPPPVSKAFSKLLNSI